MKARFKPPPHSRMMPPTASGRPLGAPAGGIFDLLALTVATAVWLLCAVPASAQAPVAGGPVSTIQVRNQLGFLLSQARSASYPPSEYARILGNIAPRVAQLAPQLASSPQEAADLRSVAKSLSPDSLGRPDLKPAWDTVLTSHPGFAGFVDERRVATALPAQREAALIKDLLIVVKRAEDAVPNLSYQEYERQTNAELMPRLKELHLSAVTRLRSLPDGGGGDTPGFAAIDEGSGGAAFVLASRWLSIPRMREAKRLQTDRMAEFQDQGRSDEYRGWNFGQQFLLAPVTDVLNDLYPQIVGRTDRALPLSARPRTVAPGRSGGIPTATMPNRPTTTTRTVVIFGTPGQLAFAKFTTDISNILGAAVEVVASGNRAIEYATDLDNRVRAARDAFWRCHYSGCASYADDFAMYSRALMEKDVQHLEANGVSRYPVDGGIVSGCSAEFKVLYDKVQADPVLRLRRNDPAGWAAGIDALFASPAYATYQACRDQKEVALRPRKSFF